MDSADVGIDAWRVQFDRMSLGLGVVGVVSILLSMSAGMPALAAISAVVAVTGAGMWWVGPRAASIGFGSVALAAAGTVVYADASDLLLAVACGTLAAVTGYRSLQYARADVRSR